VTIIGAMPMYKHLLVPIDASVLSEGLVSCAIEAASRAGARIIFFHASPDYAESSDGALAHAAWPADYQNLANAQSLKLLAKAEAAARVAGVVCNSASAPSARPHEAIHQAAVEYDCDLIFIASRSRGKVARLLHRSVTSRLLEVSTLPVLVASGQARGPLTDEEIAVTAVRDEHRSLAAVLQALKEVIQQAGMIGLPADIRLLRAMLFYVDAFPERLHHPKEEIYLYRKLRERAPEYSALLDSLQHDHDTGGARLQELREALDVLAQNPVSGLKEFLAVVDEFTVRQLRHMSVEEQSLLPAARAHLKPADWTEIKHAFQDNADPRFGADADEPFDHLLGRLLSLARGHIG
jgi:nucleotide-binding universal stress UspA family protein/hemerythrin-like domain-containing protein